LENSLKQVKFVASQTPENFLKIAKQAQFFSGSFPAQTFKLSFIFNFSEGSFIFMKAAFWRQPKLFTLNS